MEQTLYFLLRIPTAGEPETVPLPGDAHPDDALLAALLHTDVTERLRLAASPDFCGEETALCYFIDARGGEKDLPVNFIGTCFYHTGCPVHGDLLLLCCARNDPQGAVSGFSESEAAQLLCWLKQEFGSVSDAL